MTLKYYGQIGAFQGPKIHPIRAPTSAGAGAKKVIIPMEFYVVLFCFQKKVCNFQAMKEAEIQYACKLVSTLN